MTWNLKDKWHMTNQTHTIAKSLNVPKPYTLYHTETKELIGCFETLELAKAAAIISGAASQETDAPITNMSRGALAKHGA